MADADVRWLQRLENYERALATLERALTLATSRPLSELEQQGLIHAFEFTHELSWLLLKDFLVDQGASGISGSRDAVREAVVRELIAAGTEATWMAMIRSHNLTSHTYNPALAEEIAQLIANQYGKELRGLQKELRRRAEQNP
ncbi:MAG: nucleotidyltransferase substrate binding protein [Prochlorococcus sp.]